MAKGTKKDAPAGAKVNVAESVSKAKDFAKTPKTATKPEISKEDGYKDPYSKKIWESEQAFYEMKLAHKNSNFTLLDAGLVESIAACIKGKTKTFTINVLDLGIKNHVDWRLPKYCLGFIRKYVPSCKGLDWKFTPIEVGEKKSHLAKFQADLKEKAVEVKEEAKG